MAPTVRASASGAEHERSRAETSRRRRERGLEVQTGVYGEVGSEWRPRDTGHAGRSSKPSILSVGRFRF